MPNKKTPSKPADLNATYDSVMEENRRLKELNADLHSQLTTMRESRTLSPQEEQGFAALREQFRVQNEEVNAIAMWLRGNKQKEINQGRHTGLRFSEVVIMYLAKGLD